MKVFVYFNLHKKCYSILSKSGSTKGKVVAHAERVAVLDPVFKVSEKGRQKVIKEKCKNVHAGVVGELNMFDGVPTRWGSEVGLEGTTITPNENPEQHNWVGLTYNPYKFESFVDKNTLDPVDDALIALLVPGATWAYAPHYK